MAGRLSAALGAVRAFGGRMKGGAMQYGKGAVCHVKRHKGRYGAGAGMAGAAGAGYAAGKRRRRKNKK